MESLIDQMTKEDLEEEIRDISFPAWEELESTYGSTNLLLAIDQLGQESSVENIIKRLEQFVKQHGID